MKDNDNKLTKDDPINHPLHYTFGEIEVIEAIEDWKLGYHLGNVVKYVARAAHKGGLEDLKKAAWYLKRYIDNKEHPLFHVHTPKQPEQAVHPLEEKETVSETVDRIISEIRTRPSAHNSHDLVERRAAGPGRRQYDPVFYRPTFYQPDKPVEQPEQRKSNEVKPPKWEESKIPEGTIIGYNKIPEGYFINGKNELVHIDDLFYRPTTVGIKPTK